MSKLLKIAGLFAGLALSTPTWALFIGGGTDVGGLDTFVPTISQPANSGDPAKLAWLNEALGTTDATINYYDDNSTAGLWSAVTDAGYSNTYAYEFDFGGTYPVPDYPEYYFLKLGNDSTAITHYLFENNESFQYAVIDFGALDFGDEDFVFNLGKISHVVGTGATSVPEPASIALMGLGLIGMGVATRRRKQS